MGNNKADDGLGGVAGNVWRIQALSLLAGINLYTPFFALHVEDRLGDGYGRVGQLIALRSVVHALSEVPSGLIADIAGARVCLFLASCLRLSAFLWLALSCSVLGFISATAIGAVADALVSGTDEALLYSSLLILDRKQDFPSCYASAKMWWPAAASLSALIGSQLLSSCSQDGDADRAVLLTCIPCGLSALVAATIVDPKPFLAAKEAAHASLANGQVDGHSSAKAEQDSVPAATHEHSLRHRSNQQQHSPESTGTIRHRHQITGDALAKTSSHAPYKLENVHSLSTLTSQYVLEPLRLSMATPQAQLACLYAVMTYVLGEVAHQFKAPLLRQLGLTDTMLGIYTALLLLVGTVGLKSSRWLCRLVGRGRALALAPLLVSTTLLLGVATTTADVTTACFILSALPWGWQRPLVSLIINERIPTSARATLISIMTLAQRIVLGGFSIVVTHVVSSEHGIVALCAALMLATIAPALLLR